MNEAGGYLNLSVEQCAFAGLDVMVAFGFAIFTPAMRQQDAVISDFRYPLMVFLERENPKSAPKVEHD
jgi:hypothetical protein